MFFRVQNMFMIKVMVKYEFVSCFLVNKQWLTSNSILINEFEWHSSIFGSFLSGFALQDIWLNHKENYIQLGMNLAFYFSV